MISERATITFKGFLGCTLIMSLKYDSENYVIKIMNQCENDKLTCFICKMFYLMLLCPVHINLLLYKDFWQLYILVFQKVSVSPWCDTRHIVFQWGRANSLSSSDTGHTSQNHSFHSPSHGPQSACKQITCTYAIYISSVHLMAVLKKKAYRRCLKWALSALGPISKIYNRIMVLNETSQNMGQ